MRTRIEQVKSRVAGAERRPRVFFQIGVVPIVSVGTNTYIHELITTAGGENTAQGPTPYPRFNREQVIAVLTGHGSQDATAANIIWRLRLPRVILAALVGATLSLGGLVFQALLRNALAEPYILGISGGSAVGAILGIILGLPRFPGVALLAFGGSMATLLLVVAITSGRAAMRKDGLILAGVMVNAFCSSVIKKAPRVTIAPKKLMSASLPVR
jgi:ABC-type Fe3+-siderophore transport system permease subunit